MPHPMVKQDDNRHRYSLILSMSMNLDIYVIVCTYNRLASLKAALSSLLQMKVPATNSWGAPLEIQSLCRKSRLLIFDVYHR